MVLVNIRVLAMSAEEIEVVVEEVAMLEAVAVKDVAVAAVEKEEAVITVVKEDNYFEAKYR